MATDQHNGDQTNHGLKLASFSGKMRRYNPLEQGTPLNHSKSHPDFGQTQVILRKILRIYQESWWYIWIRSDHSIFRNQSTNGDSKSIFCSVPRLGTYKKHQTTLRTRALFNLRFAMTFRAPGVHSGHASWRPGWKSVDTHCPKKPSDTQRWKWTSIYLRWICLDSIENDSWFSFFGNDLFQMDVVMVFFYPPGGIQYTQIRSIRTIFG